MGFLLQLFFLGCFVYLLITYAIRRVYLLNRTGISGDIPVRFDAKALTLFFQEYFFVCVHILLLLADYALTPFSFIISKISPKSCNAEHELQPPIILIHGYMMRGGVMWPMQRYLRRKGFNRVFLFTYKGYSNDITSFAEQLAEEVERVVSQCGGGKVDLVAHSMGGLVARYYINYLGGDQHVERLVTLGTPHNGTQVWALSSFISGVQMRPGSRFLNRLAENDEKLQTVRICSIYTDFDELIIPEESSVLEGKSIINRKIPGLGHAGLVYHRRVYKEIIETLRRKAV